MKLYKIFDGEKTEYKLNALDMALYKAIHELQMISAPISLIVRLQIAAVWKIKDETPIRNPSVGPDDYWSKLCQLIFMGADKKDIDPDTVRIDVVNRAVNDLMNLAEETVEAARNAGKTNFRPVKGRDSADLATLTRKRERKLNELQVRATAVPLSEKKKICSLEKWNNHTLSEAHHLRDLAMKASVVATAESDVKELDKAVADAQAVVDTVVIKNDLDPMAFYFESAKILFPDCSDLTEDEAGSILVNQVLLASTIFF